MIEEKDKETILKVLDYIVSIQNKFDESILKLVELVKDDQTTYSELWRITTQLRTNADILAQRSNRLLEFFDGRL